MNRLHLSSDHWTEPLPGVHALAPLDPGIALQHAARAARVILQGGSGTWWIDVGPEGAPPPLSPDFGLLTHSHPDHVCGIPQDQIDRFWLSHRNPTAWKHEQYVVDFWQQYQQVCDLAAGLSREELCRAFPPLCLHLQDAPDAWTAAVLECIRLRCRELHPTHVELGRTQDLERQPLRSIVLHGTTWEGWDFEDLVVIPTRGHAPDHVVAYWRPAKLWILGDELSAVPVWPDSDPWVSADFRTRLIGALSDEDWIIGGHQPSLWKGALARQALARINLIWEGFYQKVRACTDIDKDYALWVAQEPNHPLLRKQFPFSILFVKQFMANVLLRNPSQSQCGGLLCEAPPHSPPAPAEGFFVKLCLTLRQLLRRASL